MNLFAKISTVVNNVLMSKWTYIAISIIWFIITFYIFAGSNDLIYIVETARCDEYVGRWGIFGDFIGGTLGTIFAIISVLLVFKTFRHQQIITKNNKVLLETQRCNDLFFELLKMYQEQEKELQIETADKRYAYNYKDFFRILIDKIYTDFIPEQNVNKNRKSASSLYMEHCLPYDSNLTMCYKLLYRIMDTIDTGNIDEKTKSSYIKMIRAQLTDEELICIRYHIRCGNYRKFALLVNKYNLLKHTPVFKLIEFKYWAQLNTLTELEKKSISMFISDFGKTLRTLHGTYTFNRCFNSLVITVVVDEYSINLNVMIKRPLNINDHLSGLGKFSDDELTNFFMCILKEVVVFSNFSTFNNYRELDFSMSNNKLHLNDTTISVSVKNIKKHPIILTYDRTKDNIKDVLDRKLH